MAKKKNSKKTQVQPAGRQFSVKSRTDRNKKLALLLLLSMIVFVAIYFAFVRAKIAVIVDIYIWSAFGLALLYVLCAFGIAYIKQKEEYKDNKEKQRLMQKLDKARRFLIILFLPMIVALLADILLINLGIASKLGF